MAKKDYTLKTTDKRNNKISSKFGKWNLKKFAIEVFRGSPPDRGWSWLILLASFVNITLIDGLSFSFGVYFPDFMAYFQSSNGTTSWASSVLNGVYLTIGPLVSALIAVCGCRKVAISGGVIFAAGLFLSTQCPSVGLFIFVYGFISGIGMGLIYLPSIVMVGFYFNKRRALATGITVCGSGIGAFVFAPLGESLLDLYAWRGATWILSAMILNCVVFSSLYRPLYTSEIIIKEEISEKLTVVDDEEPPSNVYLVSKDFHESVINISEKETSTIESFNIENDSITTPMSDRVRPHAKVNAPLRTIEHHTNATDQISEHELQIKETSNDSVCKHFCSTFLNELGDFKTNRNPAVLLYGVAHFLLLLGYFTPVTYLPLMARQLGSSGQEAAFLISILGIVTSIGRISVGYIADKPWANVVLLNSIALIVIGGATIIVPFLTHYALLATYCGVFGLCMAAAICLPSIICVQIVGLKSMPSAFGFITLCQGLSSFVGTPITGTIADYTGNFNISFYFAGMLFLVAGVITLPLNRISSWHNNRHKESATNAM